MSWWALAGVDAAVGEAPVSWLRPRVAPTPASEFRPREPVVPDDLGPFGQWLSNAPDLPEAGWSDRRILPVGNAKPALMVICDVPDPDDDAAGQLLSGDIGKLFDAMLRSIGFDRSEIYLCSLALSRPPGGLIDEGVETVLGERMRRHIRLVAPKRALLLGDRTSRALLSANAGAPGSRLSALNHEGGTVDAVATFHPRLLMREPAAKAGCWRALQHLIKASH
jgi:uracil-DNA glycosylase family 4